MRKKVLSTREPRSEVNYEKLAFFTKLAGGIVSLFILGYAIFWAIFIGGGVYVAIVLVIISGVTWMLFSKMASKIKELGAG